MGNANLIKADRALRWIHLYTGFFLLPWILIYGTSAFCLNHNKWFNKKLNLKPISWEVQREVGFATDDEFPQDRKEQAGEILEFLDLEGPHRVLPNAKQLTGASPCSPQCQAVDNHADVRDGKLSHYLAQAWFATRRREAELFFLLQAYAWPAFSRRIRPAVFR
jgi:hypothetical protein